MKRYLFTIIISFFLVIFGIVLTVSEVMDYTVKDNFVTEAISKKVITYDVKKTQELIEINTTDTHEATIMYDNEIAVGNIKIVVNYYDDFVEIDKVSVVQDSKDMIYIDAVYVDHFNSFKKLFNVTIDGLKRKEVYNYPKALSPDVRIIINEADKEFVKIGK